MGETESGSIPTDEQSQSKSQHDLQQHDSPQHDLQQPERLQKILSSHGIASRRHAEQMILDGRVCVNGAVATLGQSALYGKDTISVDGVLLEPRGEHVYIMLNKPRGYITTARDDRGRKTVMELVEGSGAKVYPVGRLDMGSEGLLLLTNDGAFAETVSHPSNNKQKVYEAQVRGLVSDALPALGRPMVIDTFTVLADRVDVIGITRRGGTLRISIHEGRNRQIRKMCAVCGLEVESLKRIAIGTLELGSLKAGQWRHLSEDEVRGLFTVDS